MKLAVYVGRRQVALLDKADPYRHVMTYLPNASVHDFVSLTMPVRTESWIWPQGLHPFFQQNLPEGLLLATLRDQTGSLFDGTDLSLLAIVGRNAIGRVRVASEGVDPFALPQPFEVNDVIQGDNSEKHFTDLVRRYAISGVSGVYPKFLSTEVSTTTNDHFNKVSVRLSRHIVKGSAERLPFLALNEHLTMEVARRAGLPTAETRLSNDGRALIVDRFDVDDTGEPIYGLEDFCSLLGLTPAEKYSTTWERIVNVAAGYIPPHRKREEFEKLALHILATYVLRNADCHSKNVALYYRSFEDVIFAPVFDMVTVTAYPDYKNNAPGLAIDGKKTWAPGGSLQRFLQVRLGVSPRKQIEMLEKLGDSISEVSREVQVSIKNFSGFREIGETMLKEWSNGLNALLNKKTSESILTTSLTGQKKSSPARTNTRTKNKKVKLLVHRKKTS